MRSLFIAVFLTLVILFSSTLSAKEKPAVKKIPETSNAIETKNTDSYNKDVKIYSKAIELNPNDVSAYISRGKVWDKKGEYDKAIKDYSRALELKPNYAEVYNNRGTVWNKTGDNDKAISDFNKAIPLNPNFA